MNCSAASRYDHAAITRASEYCRVARHFVGIAHTDRREFNTKGRATDRGLEITPRGFGDACEVGGGEIVQDRSGPLRGLVDIGVAADSCDLP